MHSDLHAPPAHAIEAVTHADPYPYYGGLRGRGPLHFDATLGLWVVVRAEAVLEALHAPGLRVRPPAEPLPHALEGSGVGEVFGHLVRMNDGAFHATHRPGVDRAAARFTPERVAEASGAACEDLRSVADPNDFLTALSVRIMATLLGVPAAKRDDTTRNVIAFAQGIAAGASTEAITRAEAATAVLMADGAREGLASVAAANRIALMQQPIDAAAGLLGNTIDLLRRGPELLETLAHPVRARALVAEVARWDAPVHNTRRFAAEDLTLAGEAIRAGDALLIVLASANRDDALNPRAEAFEIERPERRSLTFGAGPHACPGETIAIEIVATSVAILASRDPHFDAFVPTGAWRPLPNARVPVFARRAG